MFDFRFSWHAVAKLCTRRIAIPAALLAAQHGSFELGHVQGCYLARVDAAAVGRCPVLKKWIGLVVVVARDGTIITAWKLRPGRRAA